MHAVAHVCMHAHVYVCNTGAFDNACVCLCMYAVVNTYMYAAGNTCVYAAVNMCVNAARNTCVYAAGTQSLRLHSSDGGYSSHVPCSASTCSCGSVSWEISARLPTVAMRFLRGAHCKRAGGRNT